MRDPPKQVSLIAEVVHRLRCRQKSLEEDRGQAPFSSGIQHAIDVIRGCLSEREIVKIVKAARKNQELARTVMRDGRFAKSGRTTQHMILELMSMSTSILELIDG